VEPPGLEQVAPYLEQLGFGLIAGFATGYALKKLGKLIAIAFGLLFVTIQLLAYFNFVAINWIKVEHILNPLFKPESLSQAWQSLVKILTFNITFAAAFVPGLVLGLRRG